jgi:(5-formylfuran-3-yl)methyl phosphate synthase
MMSLEVGKASSTRLLISVRSAAEAELALSAGVTLLDVKEPLYGPLGAASAEVLHSIAEVVENRMAEESSPDGYPLMLSAALGELLEYETNALPPGYQLAKFGLAGCAAIDDWPHKWRSAIATLPVGVEPVAVVYADYERAKAPRPSDVIAVGRELGCSYVLVDSFDKSQGNLLELWHWIEIERLVEQVQSHALRIVLAGSLSISAIRRLLPLHPAVVAVRGAACGGDRNGSLDPERVDELVSLVQGHSRAARTQPVALL